MDVGKCNDVIMWRDRRLFGRDTSGKGEDWVAALAAYAAAQSRVGLPGINTPHVARLVRLLSQTSSLTVTIEVARRVFLDASGVALVRGDSRSSAAPLFLGVLSLLFCGIHTKKRAIIQKIGITLSDEELLPQLQDMLNELGILNSFIRAVLEKLQEKQSAGCLHKGDDVLGGHDELACHMIACLTLTTTPAKLDHAVPESVISPLEEWRTLLSYVLSATPSHQCNVDVLGALMEGVQDSVVVLNVLQKHPVPSFVSCDEAFKSLWCDALMIVSSREDLSRHFVNKDDVPRASRKGKFAADFLETLFQCASLTADKGLAAMRTICDSVVRPHSLTLSEEAESLLKMACINNSDEGGGFGWRAVYRSVKEGLPQAAQRHSHDMSVDEQEHLQQLSCLFSGGEPPTPESVEVLKILVERRTADVVLRGPHCRDVLDLLEKKAGKMKAAEVGDVIMHICFEQLRSGVAPHVKDVRQCVRILSREEVSPLLLLQYARAISLFPQLEDGSCTERGSPSPASHPARTTGVNSWTSPVKELPSLLTAVMIRTQAEFQRSSNVSTEEVNECIDMLSSLLQWIATLVRIPRFERNLMESIVTVMCTLVEKTPVTEEVEVTSKHDADERADKSSLRNDSGDIRELLAGTFIRLRDPEADGESSCPPKPLRNYYFYREPIGKRGCSGLGMAESSFPDADTFARLRRSAFAAACLVKQQMSLHRTLDISLPLLCRTFAAAVAGTSLEESSVAVGVLSEIAQDERLISPPVRSLLILTVAEQCVVWNLACSGSPSTVQVGEIPPATVVRAVSHTHNAVRLQFAPRNAMVLSELLVPSKNTACSGEYDVREDRGEPSHAHKTCGGIARCAVPASLGSTYAEEEESDELSCYGHNANSLLWEKSLKLFGVLAANANSDADLSLPFTKLVEILCHSGQWGLACQCVVQAIARSDRSTKHPSHGILGTVVGGKLGSTSGSAGVEISCLLQRHVVVDAFLLERLVTTIEAERRRRQYEHVIAHGSVAGHPSGFWYLALDALGSQEVFIRQSFDQADGKRNSEKDLFLTSPSILAIMKKICTR
ncbi:unnamed protein product [Trypanosoma congolense IL3000]|uniref:WGS project CAEQ00000000 data, annotated contig 772 n=1 Tax=Trypanosoma congolense (strain IL3000) TaxID=1068625 RepID=F9WID9_TRYCI|nr:unnamed protein product [Trypanosoma congolense IL3000]